MIMNGGHLDHVKVKSAELKIHLGRYLRQVEQEGATLEVCVRERTVAYLVPARPADGWGKGAEAGVLSSLKPLGLNVSRATRSSGGGTLPDPVQAGDGREDIVTVEELRRGRDW